MSAIPVMRPKLPSAERLHPYLQQIDGARVYSNFGPLASSLEERLEGHFRLPKGAVTTVANATFGLATALSAQGARRGTLCVMPAWTFVASAHAALIAGLTPYFVDVAPDTWALEPEPVLKSISEAPAEVGAVMPVAPFGHAIDIPAWDRFRSATRLPVVIDAAAGFDTLVPGDVPAVVSLHATKVIGTGEGGFVASRDAALVRGIRARTNFGFDGTREAIAPSSNAKLSEYHAAVGLAALDEWHETRSEWMNVARAYRKALPESNRLNFQDGFGEHWVSSTCLLHFAGANAGRIAVALDEDGVETRRWWGKGAHAHPATAAFPRTSLVATETLAETTIAIPFYRDLSESDATYVTERLLAASVL
jgi:dTDP-4-amino-4,6-dideoxygalactose transaminase